MKSKWILAATITIVLAACSRERVDQAQQSAENAATKVAEKVEVALDVAVPVGVDDPAAREKERFDEEWRALQGFGEVQRVATAPKPADVKFVPGGKESFKGLEVAAINAAPVVVPLKGDVTGPSVLKTQVYLDRLNFSVGALDGRWGRNTAIALWWYQRSRGIEAKEPGALDEATFRALAGEAGGVPAVAEHPVVAEEIAGPFVTIPDDVYEQEKLECLCYESKLEQLAERFHTTEEFLEMLNPGVDLKAVEAGARISVPNVRPPATEHPHDIARVVISIKGNTFNAFDANGGLIFHGPTTLGSKYDPSPQETLEVVRTAFDPHFHYQPKLFADVPDDKPEANLKPGPNSPVGVVWIALSKPHYGIHGTKDPASIGYASSHGCVRLTNWDAREVGKRISKGVKIEFQDTRV